MDEASAFTVERRPPLVEPLVTPEARKACNASSIVFAAKVVLPPAPVTVPPAAAVPAVFYLYESKKKNNHHIVSKVNTQ